MYEFFTIIMSEKISSESEPELDRDSQYHLAVSPVVRFAAAQIRKSGGKILSISMTNDGPSFRIRNSDGAQSGLVFYGYHAPTDAYLY